MGTDQRQKKVIIKCDLCIRSAETEVTGPLSKKGQLTAHQNCLLYSSGICCKNTPSFDDLFGFSVEDVENELKRGSRLTCNKCKKNGATVGCEVKRCKKSYHYPCAIEDGAFAEENQDKGTFGLYCKKHLLKESETSDSAKIKPSSNRDPKSDINQKTSQKRRISSNGNSEHEGPKDSASKRRNLIMIDESFSSDSSETDLKLLAPLESSDLDNSGSLEPKEPGCQQSRTNSDGASFSGKLQETENREEEIILVWDTDSQSLLPSVQCVIETSQVSGCRPGAVQNSPTPEPPTPVRGSPGPDGDPPSPAVSKTPSLTSSPVLMEKFNLCPSSSQPSSRPPSSSREPCLTGLSSHGEQESASATFWRQCNKAGCTQAIFSEFMNEISIIFNRIRSEQASQEDYDLSLRVMEASGKLAEIVANQERELQRKQERLLRAATAMKDALLALKR